MSTKQKIELPKKPALPVKPAPSKPVVPPPLPKGITVEKPPVDVAFFQHRSTKFVPHVEALRYWAEVDPLMKIKIPIHDMTKMQIQALRTGIRNTAKEMNVTGRIEFASWDDLATDKKVLWAWLLPNEGPRRYTKHGQVKSPDAGRERVEKEEREMEHGNRHTD